MSTWLSLGAAAAMLSLMAWVGYFALPAASVTVSPAATALSITVPVVADSATGSVDLGGGRIPAKTVTAEVTGERVVKASGQRDIPGTPARGTVTFTNLTEDPLTIPNSTIVLAGSKVFFTTLDTTLLPSMTIGGFPVPGTANVFVQSTDGGDQTNVAAGAITAVQGSLAGKVSVVNSAPLTGGSNKTATYLSAEDQAQAKQALLDSLRQQDMDKAKSQIAKNETFLASPSSSGDGAVEELTYEESPEQVTTQTTLHMKVLVRGLIFQGDDVNQVVADSFSRAVAQQAPGSQQLNTPLSIDPPVVTGNDGSAINLQVHTSGRIATPIDSRKVEEATSGLDPAAAQAALGKLPGVAKSSIDLWPGWVKKVPAASWRIHVSITDPVS